MSEAPRLPLRSLPKFGKSVELEWRTPPHALFATVTRSHAGIEIETAGVSVMVGMREWPMPRARSRAHGTRERFACPRCNASRDALHWVGEWGCRGCWLLAFDIHHSWRWCTAIGRRARLLRKLARVSSRSLKARALRKMIAREQRAMLANLKRTNHVLAKRSARHARQQRRINPGTD